ncbi:hypothetical protein PUNSTDRAFT_75311 [Punctularia strigosozonata HHB-11173 SS5]|uniref:ATPase, V0 complex, subunit E n=1 Tax=Punctularia strigosozonata (strain HHB-11173) TaxID=741275 RepID=R7S5T8_PUNST|nr:uncharacterized protein PUNSTDRAFT_75311 [Punctularia strigosozonata HHB-11173 SS5]EIN05041.1 hypothetical protein PUNSTDRAFT_75311 [Punctularia strigosozonata HHB-11173 SS5]
MSSVLPVWFLLVIVLGLMFVSWIFTPKGPNQTLIRTSFSLALACCYLMWMVTYLAQVHPLICTRWFLQSIIGNLTTYFATR